MRKITSLATGFALLGGLVYASPALAAPIATKVTINVNHAPGHIGDEVTIYGKLTKASGGALKGRQLLINAAGKRKIVTTNGEGGYITDVKVPHSGAFTAEFLGDDDANESAAATQTYTIQYKTAIFQLAAKPKPVERNTAVAITGRTFKFGVNGDAQETGNAGLDLQYSTDGRNWNYSASTTSDGKGWFRFTPIAGADATWRVILKPNYTADGLLGAQRDIRVDTRWRTGLSAKVTPKNLRKGKKVTVYGNLTHKVDGIWGPLGKVRVAVYFRAKGSKKWKFRGWVTVGGNGKYGKKFVAAKDGYWRVAFHGNGDNFARTSGATYVNVR
ncbi:hypothetical protein GCM10027589_23960 [Actinocorallia lasiicapitis]